MLPQVSDEMDLDLEAQLGLLGDDSEKRDAIRVLYLRYRERLMCFLESRIAYLPSDEAANAVNDTFKIIYEKACAGTLDVNRPLRPLLFNISYCRAVDAVRKRSARQKQDDEFAADIGEALSGTDTGSAWKIFCGEGDLAENIFAEFRAFVPTLPPKQKMVAEIMADGVGWGPQEIAKEIYNRRRVVVSAVEVKGAKQALLNKFRDILKQKGVR